MKTRWIAGIALLLALALPLALYAQAADPLSVVEAWATALNAHDIDSALSYLAGDAVVTLVPAAPGTSGVFTGPEEIRGWYDGQAAGNATTTLSDCQVEGETVTCTDTYTDDGLQAMGVDFIDGAYVAVVRDGKIRSYVFTMSPESLAKLGPPPEALPQTGGPGMAAELPLGLGLGGLLAAAAGLGLRWLTRRLRWAARG
jgi:ketosteroid isomerase-like protein